MTGELEKREYGSWMLGAFRILARFKFLRGTPLDPFGRTEERRTERALITRYEKTVDELLDGLTADNRALAVEIASLPEFIRGFGHVKERAIETATEREARLMAAFRDPSAAQAASAAD